MDDKKAREAFRVQQFGGPHPALQAAAAEDSLAGIKAAEASAQTAAAAGAAPAVDAGDPLNINLVPDHERVVLHFDVDCFYAQGELATVSQLQLFMACRERAGDGIMTAISLIHIHCVAPALCNHCVLLSVSGGKSQPSPAG